MFMMLSVRLAISPLMRRTGGSAKLIGARTIFLRLVRARKKLPLEDRDVTAGRVGLDYQYVRATS
jgi:hypothetical protein